VIIVAIWAKIETRLPVSWTKKFAGFDAICCSAL
jgi:hypothetical protein